MCSSKNNKENPSPDSSPIAHYNGVFSARRKNGEIYFRASLTHKNKHISLGSFREPQKAHQAYLEGGRLLSDKTVSLIDYNRSSPLSFEKWVCLINYRDNSIYLSSPIYIGQRIIYYYLSPSHILKFDMDDLFYYSSHKIMCRGRHYFVSDYGMQVNIAARYGIKNYAVRGRDYDFINGDETDFRRENISVTNIYHGLRKSDVKGGTIYSVYIHVRGNLLVGRYDSEIKAAIAYNKAIDILKKNGVNKNYTPNYIDGLSPSKYAEIYSALTISRGIINFRIKDKI
ncbi:MAG: hypothetical protein LUG83_04180 [Lachnospiraceae bacterium]|nr:hypothetical protein [Lachnospiraceae bacterium]